MARAPWRFIAWSASTRWRSSACGSHAVNRQRQGSAPHGRADGDATVLVVGIDSGKAVAEVHCVTEGSDGVWSCARSSTPVARPADLDAGAPSSVLFTGLLVGLPHANTSTNATGAAPAPRCSSPTAHWTLSRWRCRVTCSPDAVDDILAVAMFEWCISTTQGGTDCDVAPMTVSPPNLRDVALVGAGGLSLDPGQYVYIGARAQRGRPVV